MNEIVQLNENTWRLEDGFVRYFLLTGTEKALLIDSGASSPDALQVAQGLTDLPVLLLNTHADADHTAGTGAFAAYYMHPADYENCGMANKFPNSRCKPLQDGDVLNIGNRPLEIVTIPGHTKGSVAILDKNAQSLFVGDTVQTGMIFMFGEHRQPDAFAASLQKLIAMQDQYRTLYPSHGEPVLPANYVQKVLAFWQEIQKGNVPTTEEMLFGRMVNVCRCADCGFYL